MSEKNTISHQLGFVNLVKLSTRSFAAKPARTVLTVLGTSVGIATVVVLVSLGYGLQTILLGKLITTEDSLVTLAASYPAESNLTVDMGQADAVAKMSAVDEVGTVAEFPGEAKAGAISGLTLIRIVDQRYFRLSGQVPDVGTDFGQGVGAVVSSQALRLLDLPMDQSTIGKSLTIGAFYQGKGDVVPHDVISMTPVPITGILTDDAEPPLIIVSRSAFTEQPTAYKELLVHARSASLLEILRAELINKGFTISAHIDLVRQAQQVTNVITIVLAVFGIAALTVSAIGMFNTMIVGFLERTYEVGVMKALGATDSDVRRLFLMEALIMGLAGGVAGILIGVGAGQVMNFAIRNLTSRLGGKPFTLFVSPLWFIMVVIGVSTAIGFLAGLIPAKRASSLSPVEAFVKK